MVGATVSRYDFDVGLFHSLLHAGCPALSGNRGYLSTVRQLRLRVVAGRAEGPMERHPLRVRYIAAELARRRGWERRAPSRPARRAVWNESLWLRSGRPGARLGWRLSTTYRRARTAAVR